MAPVKTTVVAPQSQQLTLMRQLLNPKQLKQGIYQAVRRTTNAAKKIFREIIQEATYLQDKYAKRAINSKVQSGDIPVGTVTISQERVPLVGYSVSATPDGGAVAMVSKDHPVIRLRHGFEARLQTEAQAESGAKAHFGIATRAKLPAGVGFVAQTAEQKQGITAMFKELGMSAPSFKATGGIMKTARGFAWRLPIDEAYGPSVLQIIDRDEVTAEAMEKLGDRFEHELTGQVRRFIDNVPPSDTEAA